VEAAQDASATLAAAPAGSAPDAAAEVAPVFLLGKSEAELVALAEADGQPAFRGRQLYSALYSKTRMASSLTDLGTLPAAWRASLAARGVTLGRSTVHAVAAAPDGTAKLLLRLGDGRVVEAVGIPSDDSTRKRLTVCVSSQVGCPMRCTFCATGKGGFARNLGAHEIVDQVQQIEAHFGKRCSHVVFMASCLAPRVLALLACTRALCADAKRYVRG
jgi:23S rRNA (adenine2503-C2)-methyltransferase